MLKVLCPILSPLGSVYQGWHKSWVSLQYSTCTPGVAGILKGKAGNIYQHGPLSSWDPKVGMV